MPDTFDLPTLGHSIGQAVREHLTQRLAEYGGRETLSDPGDLKSSHAIDEFAADIAAAALGDLRCNIFIEGQSIRFDPNAPLSFYIDPVDGSTNWDRCVGDPAFVIAYCEGPAAPTLGDLQGAYVEGLASGDRYWAQGGAAAWRCARTGRVVRLGPRPAVSLQQATGYIRCGYGGARAQLEVSIPLMMECRDIRAFDNAGTELCEVARGAAHFLLEARGFSDGFNLLAYPILRAAGGVLLGLGGEALESVRFDPGEHYDYVAASSLELAHEVVSHLGTRSGQRTQVTESVFPI